MNGCTMQTEKVISHILEIIYLMTGEEYMIVKKPPQYKCFSQVSEDLCQTKNSVLEIPADSPVHVRRRSGCNSSSWLTHGMLGEAQTESLDSAFLPPPGGTHVQIKCDDVAMSLSMEEWEYLDHHKEEYEVMTGMNHSSPDGPYGQCLQAAYRSQLDSEERDCTNNGNTEETNTIDWNSENRFTPPKVSSISSCEANSSPKRESSDKIYGQKNMTVETWGSTQSREFSAMQNNETLIHEPLSSTFLGAEIKDEQINFEYAMDGCEDTTVKISSSDQGDSPSLDSIQNLFSGILQKTCSHNAWSKQECLLDSHQIKTGNITDSFVENKYTLDFMPQSFSEKPQHIPILDDHQPKMTELIDSNLLNSHTLDHVQTNKRCSIIGHEIKNKEESDFRLQSDHSLSLTNILKDIPPKTHKKTELKIQECSRDGHQTKTIDTKQSSLENDAKSISNIFQNVFEKAHIKREPTYQVCSTDETMKVGINDSLVEGNDAFYALPNSFADGLQRTCLKTEPVHQEHDTNSLQQKTMDKNDSALVDSHISGCDTRPLQCHGKRQLTYQECSMHSPQTKIVEFFHTTPENNSNLSIDWQANIKPSISLDHQYLIKEPVQHSKNSTWKTGRVQPNSKPLKMVSCSDCGKMFSCNSYLSRHQRLHTGEKPFTCSECGKSFSWMSSLVTHKRTHLGEKPFSCKQCGKRFSDYSGIIKHRRSHTGEKPYSCLMCGERFAQTYQLVKHQAVHLVEDVAEKS